MAINILIADDHAIVRSGLTMLVEGQEDMKVIGTAADGKEAFEKATELEPDVVLMDINMPPGENGLVATKRLREAMPHIHILILSMHDDREYVYRALHAGASGYILKSADDFDLISAIRTVEEGAAYLYPEATKTIIEDYLTKVSDEESKISNLSAREQEILALLAKGYTNREIGDLIHVSVKTVETHRSKIMEKLNLKTRPDLVKYAFKQGLLDFE